MLRKGGKRDSHNDVTLHHHLTALCHNDRIKTFFIIYLVIYFDLSDIAIIFSCFLIKVGNCYCIEFHVPLPRIRAVTESRRHSLLITRGSVVITNGVMTGCHCSPHPVMRLIEGERSTCCLQLLSVNLMKQAVDSGEGEDW